MRRHVTSGELDLVKKKAKIFVDPLTDSEWRLSHILSLAEMAIWFVLFVSVLKTAAGAAIVEPEAVQCVDSTVTLSVKEARVNVGGQFTFSTRLYHLDGQPMLPGPSIHPKAGHSCTIKVVNELSTTSDAATCNFHANGPHCPDTTNLHTHNLHVSPLQDDVSSFILPGEELAYQYDIQQDHLMGTQWYHPHYHGSTHLQASGGMAGMLIVEPSDTYELPTDLDALYGSEAVTYMIFSHWKVEEMLELHNDFSTPTIDPDFDVTGLTEFVTANGQYQPTVSIDADSAHLLRMVFAGSDETMELELADDVGCVMTVVARDGVFQYTPYITVDAIVFYPGNRNDIAIRCPASAAGSTIAVAAHPSNSRDAFLDNNRITQDIVFYIEIGDVPVSPIPVPYSQAPLSDNLQSLLGQPLASVQPIRELIFNRDKINNIDYHGFGTSSSHVASVCLNEIYEYTPKSWDRWKHPYHQHVNHFQIVSSADDSGTTHRTGEWRDVAGANGDTVRFKPTHFTGEVIMHCHILEHEDNGMMALWNIVDCDSSVDVLSLIAASSTSAGSKLSSYLALVASLALLGVLAF